MISFPLASRLLLRISLMMTALLAIIPVIFAQTVSSVAVTPNPVVGGFAAVGTVTLSAAAPAGGFTVPLSKDNSVATIPLWVVVPAGKTTANFKIKTVPVAANTDVKITAKGGGATVDTTFTVAITSVTSVTLNPDTVLAGNSSTGTVTLVGAAPDGGFTVNLSSDTLAASVPGSVTVPAGATSATFTVTTLGVDDSGTANIEADGGGGSATAVLKITSASLDTLTVDPTSVLGGGVATGTVTLDAESPIFGTEITLKSNSSKVKVPGSVIVPAGARSATFTVKTLGVTNDLPTKITASFFGLSKQVNFTVLAPFATVSVAPVSVIGGTSAVGTVTLSEPAPTKGTTVILGSSSTSAVVPSTIVIPKGLTTGTFVVTTIPVAANDALKISATRGTSVNTADFTVVQPSTLAVSVNPTILIGGNSSLGTVTISGPAPKGGITVTLGSNQAAAPVPASVVVPEGAVTSTFPIVTKTVKVDVVATITATLVTSTTASLRVTTGPALSTSEWPKFRGGVTNTGQGIGPVALGTLKWSYTVRKGINSSAVIGSDGTIYVGGDVAARGLMAFKPDGTLKWTFATGSDFINGLDTISSPAVATDGSVYIASGDRLFSVNADGSFRWSRQLDGPIPSSPTIGSDGTVYVGTYGGKLYAVASSGKVRWAFNAGNIIYSSPAIATDGTVYIGTGVTFSPNPGKLIAVNIDGTKKWEFTAGGAVASSPAIGADGTVYAGSSDGHLYAVSSAGSLTWKLKTGAVINSSPAVATDGTIYVGSGFNLIAVNPAGTKQWSFGTGGNVDSSPAITKEGTVYVGSADGSVYAVSKLGKKVWSFVTGAAVYSSPTISLDGTVYFGSQDFKFYAIK